MNQKTAVVVPVITEEFLRSAETAGYSGEILTLSAQFGSSEKLNVQVFPSLRPGDRWDILKQKLDQLDSRTLVPGISPLSPPEEKIYLEEGLGSPSLEEYLRLYSGRYSEILVMDAGSPLGIRILSLKLKCIKTAIFSIDRTLYLSSAAEAAYGTDRILAATREEAEILLRFLGPAVSESIFISGGIAEILKTAGSGHSERESFLNIKTSVLRETNRPEFRVFAGIHQMLPTLTTGDAISNQVIYIRSLIRRMGYPSEIFVENRDSSVSGLCQYYRPGVLNPEDLVLYHHSIGTPLTREAAQHPGPKMLIYHNITPPEFYEPYNPRFVNILKKGLDDLHDLSVRFDECAGVSRFNLNDLHRYGFKGGEILPIIVDPRRWACLPDQKLMRELNDGRINIIFVGRLSPNKKQEEVIDIFYQLKVRHPSARLYLVGDGAGQAKYVQSLYERIWKYQCGENIFITGKVTESQLHAYYRSAHLFLSMSEHEGFGVPLIEAMWFDIPVVALGAAAIPETMGEGGVLIGKDSPLNTADLLSVILESPDLRRDISIGQRKNILRFLPVNLTELYTSSLEHLAEKFINRKKNVFT